MKLRQMSEEEIKKDPLLIAVKKMLVEWDLDYDFKRKEVIDYVKEI